ncbi:DUF397 domain-containing protein [Streptomyces evansiae]|uniref:DUF397 domain-containing protein n=1 Tax=Streptomyces evansiae TaxID=3075535 RepID=UPI0028859951|nr:DUF397 domain-containing protein [Streptomyces sp. DSM 41859]MDT0420895.1 DUF397 domain-containing protein [Streptomyces sp. DSM 41859]
MHHTDLTALSWRKSTYSNSDGGACVEVSDDLPALVPVRDSKRPSAAYLVFPAARWAAFVAMVRQQI